MFKKRIAAPAAEDGPFFTILRSIRGLSSSNRGACSWWRRNASPVSP